MIRSLKILGPAVLAVLAMATAGAAPASAALFHSEVEDTTIEGTQASAHIFQFGEILITCDGGTLKGTQPVKTTESLTLTPSYTGCHMVIGGATISVTPKFNGCDFRVFAGGSANLECPPGKILEFSSTYCTWKLGSQTVKSAAYDNNGKHLDVTWALGGLTYTYASLLCGSGAKNNGAFQGTTTLQGKSSKGEPVKIWWE